MVLRHIEGHTVVAADLGADSIVLDLGANRGRFSQAMLAAFSCSCCAVEANPAMFDLIPSHPRLRKYNLALAATSGVLPFHLANNSEESSLARDSRDGERTIAVKAVTFKEFLETAGLERVDLVKFDIEGAEIGVLDSCPDDVLRRIPQLTIEFHDFLGLTPEPTVRRVVHRLEGLGFFPIKFWREAWGDTLFVNRRLSSVSLPSLWWARYVTRNWWGLKRILSRRSQQ